MKKVPVFRQLESIDCGLVCVQMIAAFYRIKISIKEMKSFCEITKLGLSMNDLKKCASKIGINLYPLQISIEEMRNAPMPVILYLKRAHFVVLENVQKKKRGYLYKTIDPAYGRVKITEEQLIEQWCGTEKGLIALASVDAHICYTSQNTKEDVNTYKNMFGIIANVLKKYRVSYLWIAVLSFCVIVANWAMPFLLKDTIDKGILNKDIGVVWMMLIAQFIFFIGFTISNNISSYLTTRASIHIDVELQAKYFKKLMKLPMAFFDTCLKTDLIQRVGDLGRMQSFLTDSLLGIAFSFINFCVFSMVLLSYNWIIFTIFSFFALLSFSYNLFFVRKRKFLEYNSLPINAEKDNYTYEMIMGIIEIKTNNAQKARISGWNKIEKKSNLLQFKMLYVDYYLSNGMAVLGRIRDISLTGFCSFMVINGSISMGTMMMISFILGQLSSPVNDFLSFFKSLQSTKLSCNRLNDIFSHSDESDNSKIKITKKNIRQGISFKNVIFKYKGFSNKNVLHEFSLDLPIGKCTAIVGASGSGKTTMLKLLLGFYCPNEGNIYIDEWNMSEIELSTWRDLCGVVMQDGKIFSGTVAENIAFADETPDVKRLEYAADIACILDRIKRLPMGFNTRIGETGIELSGGEKQRILIARAVYKNPDFIFFDEATSSLDAATERKIMKNLLEFSEGKTVVIIAHRLSTVKNADNIVFMDKGSIVEQGTHEELISLRGAYYELVGNQLELDKGKGC